MYLISQGTTLLPDLENRQTIFHIEYFICHFCFIIIIIIIIYITIIIIIVIIIIIIIVVIVTLLFCCLEMRKYKLYKFV